MTKSKLGNLLVVDDEIDTLDPLCDLLSKWGYKVTACTSGREALETLKKRDIDVLLTDLVMPEMDGIQLILAAMNIDPHLVSIVITGQGTIQTAVEAMKTGAFDYLLKPIEWKMLQPVLSRAIKVRLLLKKEERYRSIVEDQTELICRFLPDSTLTFVNKAYCRYFAREEDDLIGQSFLSLIPEEDREEVKKLIFSLNIQNPLETHENRVINTDGKVGWQQWTNRVLFDDHGNIIEYQSVGCDITKRKKAEEALKESEEKIRELADSITDVFFAMDKDLKYIYWNKASESLIGISEKEAIRKSLYDIFPDTPETRRAEKVYLDVLRTQQPQNFITRYQIKDKEHYFEINAYPSKKGLSVFVKDITERKNIEQALIEREKELAQKTLNLEEVNTALRVLLDKRDDDKLRLEESILLNIHELVEPYSEKLRKSGLNGLQKNLLEIIESNLKEIVSSFAHTLSASYLGFTPTEIQIANLIKQGRTSKEISELLCVTPRAISFHRDNIRKKLGLNNKKTNLKTYLSSLK